jgi:hypothetical protein
MAACTAAKSKLNDLVDLMGADLIRAYVPPRQGWAGAGASGLNPAARAAELPTSKSPLGNKRASADNYYEDVDPRFVEGPGVPPSHDDRKANVAPLALGLDEDSHIPPGSRSPSERSEFTSVSQRGVNPAWNQTGYPMPPNRRGMNAQPQRADVLNSNPDFEVPGGPRRGKSPGQLTGAGMVPSSAYDGAL